MGSVEPVRVVESVDEVLAGATDREVLVADDGKSGNQLERMVVDGQRLVVKHMSLAGDWIMRVVGDRVFWPHVAARAGLFDQVPPCIDHAVVAMALEGDPTTGTLHVVMHDVGEHIVPEGDSPVTVEQHRGFLSHMATMHATYWGWQDDLGLQPMALRLLPFAPATIAPELTRPDVPGPVAVADEGWSRLPERAPELAELVFDLQADPAPLVAALASTPATFLHGDWKMGNLGWHPEGRTILLDWAYLGEGPATWDLLWYLALNRARLPESKESSIETYRRALETAGVETDAWWERQLGLATIGMMVCFAWEKAVGDDDELRWWGDRVDDSEALVDMTAVPGDHVTVGDLYEDVHLAWSSGAEPVYGPMAEALVQRSPIALAGRRVLDVGAGTGAGSRALLSVGAEPIALDLAFSMLAHDHEHRPPAVVADLYRPPIRATSVGGVLAPFVLNHVDAPVDALAALADCVESGGVVLASTFSEDDRPPVKDVIDAVALRHGVEIPEAYRFVREQSAPLVGRAGAMADVAAASGLVEVEAVAAAVDTGISDPADLVAYRFALPHLTRFLDDLSPEARAALVAEAVDEVTRHHDGTPLAPVVVFLSARVP